MVQPADTLSTYGTTGIREDLADVIYLIDPVDTPFMSMVEQVDASATNHEWQTQALAGASDANAVIEGDDATTDAATPTARLGNYTQISDKVPRVSGTNRAVTSAGRADEMDYQVMLKGMELRRDMESSLLANKAKVAGNDTTARVLAGIYSWLATNCSVGATGSAPTGDGTDTATPGTPRSLSETIFDDSIRGCWEEGGNPDYVLTTGTLKQAFSKLTFSSITKFDRTEDQTLYAAVEVFVSDFGTLKLVPDRFIVDQTMAILQMDLWGVAFLRNMVRQPLAKTGDTDREQIIVEYTEEARSEKGNAAIHAITP